MDDAEVRALAAMLKPHADQVMRIWDEGQVVPRCHRATTEPLTPDGYPEYSKYAEIVAGWDEWAHWVAAQPGRDRREADAWRSVGRIHARAIREMDEKSPRQAAMDAYRPSGPSVEEIEQRIVAARESEAWLQGALAWRGDGPSLTYIVNCFRIRMSLPLLSAGEDGDTDTSPPTG